MDVKQVAEFMDDRVSLNAGREFCARAIEQGKLEEIQGENAARFLSARVEVFLMEEMQFLLSGLLPDEAKARLSTLDERSTALGKACLEDFLKEKS